MVQCSDMKDHKWEDKDNFNSLDVNIYIKIQINLAQTII